MVYKSKISIDNKKKAEKRWCNSKKAPAGAPSFIKKLDFARAASSWRPQNCSICGLTGHKKTTCTKTAAAGSDAMAM